MLLIRVERAQTASYVFWGIIRKKSMPCIPVLFASLCLEEAAPVSVPPLGATDVQPPFQLRAAQKAPFVSPPVILLLFLSHSCISICLLTTTTPTHDNKWTMGLSDASAWFICKTKTFHATCWMPFLAPPGGEHIVPVPARPRLNSPLGGPDLHAHSFPNWALNPSKKRWGKKREKETKSYFYGKLRSDCRAISQVHLNKSIKAYPKMKGKKKGPSPSPTVLFFFAVYIWQSKLWSGVCASVYLKLTEHR